MILIQPSNHTSSLPFENHPQFPAMVDILSRKDSHHLLLQTDFSHRLRQAFLEAFLLYLTHENIPASLHVKELRWLNSESNIELATNDQRYSLFGTHYPLNNNLTHHSHCRLLSFTDKKSTLTDSRFITLALATPTENDKLLLLNQHRHELEDFHQVTLPDKLLIDAYALAERYLSNQQVIEKTFLLLDSSAARTTTHLHSTQTKPVVTHNTLMEVLSHFTHIPTSRLQPASHRTHTVIDDLQQKMFGQPQAIQLIANALQQSYSPLQPKTGPLASFLFAGPQHVGKKTMARALAHQLFHHSQALYFALASPNPTTLAETKFHSHNDRERLQLKDLIQKTPYAILYFDHLDQAPTPFLTELADLLRTGYLYDDTGKHYHFTQAIIILTTTIGSTRTTRHAQSVTTDKDEPIGFQQIIASPAKQKSIQSDEVILDIAKDITASSLTNLDELAHIIPFYPLDQSAIEQIIRLKLKDIGHTLQSRYKIELGYAPEIVRFIANDIYRKEKIELSLDKQKALRSLYFTIEQALQHRSNSSQYSNQLFLQLNEVGHTIRCDWLKAKEHDQTSYS